MTDDKHPTADDQQPTTEHVPFWPYAVAFAGLVVAGIAFGLMAREARQALVDGPDQHVARWVAAHREAYPVTTRFFLLATRLGDGPMAIGLSLAAAVALVAFPTGRTTWARVREAAFWLGVLSSSWFLNRVLKTIFERDRPPSLERLVRIDDLSFSFPSGHAAFAGCFFGLLAIRLAWHLGHRHIGIRLAASASCVVLMLAVAASRVWLSVHYVSDVVGGLALGLGWAVIAWTIHYGWLHWRRWRRRLASA
jgi:undecaprenyl-diphosphatase